MPLDTGIGQYRAGFQRFCISGINPVAAECQGILWGQMHDPANPPTATSFSDVNLAATPNEVVQILSPNHAAQLFGQDSQLAHAAVMYFCNADGFLGNGGLWAMPLLDDAGATAGVYEINIGGAVAAGGGTLAFRLPINAATATEGYYSISVGPTDTVDLIATAIADEINADEQSLFSAVANAVTPGVVTLTGKHAGQILADSVFELNPLYGDATPSGLVVTYTTVTAGVGNPDISTALGNLPDCPYDCWGLLNEDETAAYLLTSEIANRWECGTEQLFGHLFTSRTEAIASDLVTYGNAYNSAERNIIANLQSYKYKGWQLVSAWTSRVCRSACENPGRPVVRDNGVLECLKDSAACGGGIFSMYEKEQLADAGMSLFSFNRSGQVYIENNITNWKYNGAGDRDVTWTSTQSRYLVPAVVAVIRRFNQTFYSSSSLVDNGVPIPVGTGIGRVTSPDLYRGHLVGYLNGTTDEDQITAGILGFLLNSADVQNDIQVMANTDGAAPGYGDCNRLDVVFKTSLIKQLLRIAVGIQVRPC